MRPPPLTMEEYELEVSRRAGAWAGNPAYCALGLVGEAGEFAEHVKKEHFRARPEKYDEKLLELGDVLWYLTASAMAMGVTLEAVARANIEKLKKRHGNSPAEAGR